MTHVLPRTGKASLRKRSTIKIASFSVRTSLPVNVGVGAAMRTRDAAYEKSWTDCLEMKQDRHPQVAADIIRGIFFLCVRTFVVHRVQCYTPTRCWSGRWEDLTAGERLEDTAGEERETQRPHDTDCGKSRRSQPRFTTERFVVWPGLAGAEQALMRCQSGSLASVSFTTLPVNRVSGVDSQLFRSLLLRRLRLPLPISVRSCRCGRLLDVFGHHWAACATAGVVGRRGFVVESAAAQICLEGGPRVPTNVMVQDQHISQTHHNDSRQLEVVAEGLSLFGGGQLALDATLVSVLHRDDTAKSRADTSDGVALREVRARKERIYEEISGGNGRARLVVITGEVEGR